MDRLLADGALLSFFTAEGFLPHALCLSVRPDILWLHASSDLLIALAYFSIPFALVWFATRRRDLQFRWVFLLFGAFITACGLTHLMHVWTLWRPDYVVEGGLKAITAAISLATAAVLWPLLPKALALPSPAQLARANTLLAEANARLAASEAHYAAFFNNVAEGLFLMQRDAAGVLRFASVNPALARILGLEPGIGPGLTPAEIMAAPDALRLTRRLTGCLDGGAIAEFEGEVTLAGGPRVLHTVLVPVGGGVMGSVRDVTENRLLQDELIQSSKLATLGTLAAGIAHETSQPLHVIRMTAEAGLMALKAGRLDVARHEDMLGMIAEQARRMGIIVDHMRGFSRRDRRHDDVFDAAQAVKRAVRLVQRQYALDDVTVAWPPPPAPVLVRGQPVRLEQVILNLLSNAFDAIAQRRRQDGRPGHIAVSLDRTGAAVVVTVADNGGGIPETMIGRVFDPFFTSKEPGEGTGLGLSISYGIIEQMGGHIDAANAGDGARFIITIPAADAVGSTGGAEAVHG